MQFGTNNKSKQVISDGVAVLKSNCIDLFGSKGVGAPVLQLVKFLLGCPSGSENYGNLTFLHSPLGNHEDLAGQIGTADGTGHGQVIATLQLYGQKSHVFIQELPSVVAKYG